MSEERPTFKPLAPAPQPSGSVAVFVDKGMQTQVQREMTEPTWLDKQQIDPTRVLKSPYYIEKIHTQHSLPSLPSVRAPLRSSRLTQMVENIPDPEKPVVHKTRKLTPLPEPVPIDIEFSEDDSDDWLNGTTKRRKAV